jgi:hypothetical protein
MDIDLKLKSTIANGVVGNDFGYPTMPPLSSIRFPSAQVLITEQAFSPTLENYSPTPSANGVDPCQRWDTFTKRHCGSSGGGILSFLDGHAGWFLYSYVINSNAVPARMEKFNGDIMWNPNRDLP